MIKEKRQFMETFLLELVQSVHDSGGLWAWLGVEKRTVRFETADGLRFPETGDGSSLALGEGGGEREGEDGVQIQRVLQSKQQQFCHESGNVSQ